MCDIQASDVQASDIQASDVQASDIQASPRPIAWKLNNKGPRIQTLLYFTSYNFWNSMSPCGSLE
jgi:hypothetical protein